MRNAIVIGSVSLSMMSSAWCLRGQAPTVQPENMRLCIDSGCQTLTWVGDHYDGYGDGDPQVGTRYQLKSWKANHVELYGKTVKLVDGVHPAEGTFTAAISSTDASVVGGVMAWNVGAKSGKSPFTLTWVQQPETNAATNTADLNSLLPPHLNTPASVPSDVSSKQGPVPAIPGAILQCEGDQCTRGGGGAVWLLDGRSGQAMWHYGAIANLTVRHYDGKTIVIHREDPNPSYSSPRFADPKRRSDGVFFADYVGKIHGNRIDGTVVWNGGGSGTWYATIPETLCQPFDQCPLDNNQMMQLGQNAVGAKEYAAALHCFLISAMQGNAEAQSLAGLMLRDGDGVLANESAAFYLLQKSADQDNYNGELGLAKMYEAGLGTPKDPERASFWKGRAEARLQQMRAAQAQREATDAMGVLLFLGMAAALVGDSGPSGSDSVHSPSSADLNRQRQQRRDYDYWSNGGTNLSAPDGYRCHAANCN